MDVVTWDGAGGDGTLGPKVERLPEKASERPARPPIDPDAAEAAVVSLAERGWAAGRVGERGPGGRSRAGAPSPEDRDGPPAPGGGRR